MMDKKQLGLTRQPMSLMQSNKASTQSSIHSQRTSALCKPPLLFIKINYAAQYSTDELLNITEQHKNQGARSTVLCCSPDKPFLHLAPTVSALIKAQHSIGVESQINDDLFLGSEAGAEFILLLNEDNLWLAEQTPATPIITPNKPGDLSALRRCIKALQKQNKPFIADPILNPLQKGFTESICKYQQLRKEFPNIDILLNTKNVPELLSSKKIGENAILEGIMAELQIQYLLI
ncbi:MAG: hypothetical protein A3F17_06100 [Gammaproteobacteria bacterium RIFCSPHIGHO2_12_FULL_41_15]|nr:MAG: hypothetical protein A3F17_06100 [Gammaproteobacteria bacterium RIFCSPHIGHO2_12_FULL_41_15]